MRWWTWLLLVLGIGFGAFTWWMLLHPPMRLMPAPAAFLADGTNAFGANPALDENPRMQIHYATNRLPVGPRDNRLYAVIPGTSTYLGTATVRIGEEGFGWERIYELSTSRSDEERPFLHLERLRETATLNAEGAPGPAARAWFARIDAELAASRDPDVTIYIHGANTTVERGVGQAAQLYHFTGRNSVVIVFVWPTAENFLRYSRDIHSALGAAPHLARLVGHLAQHTRARNIDLMTYSAGGTVGSEAAALIGRWSREPGAFDPRLGEVYHAAPDADFRSFVDDMRDYADVAGRVTVTLNMNDSALRLAQTINRGSRAGRPDMTELTPEQSEWLLSAAETYGAEIIQVRPENLPDLSRTSHTFWYEDPWISSDVLISLLWELPPDERGLAPDVSPSGKPYWYYPPDYPERLAEVLDRLRAGAAP